MSSGYTEFLNFTGPLQKDTTFTRDGIKWSQFQPVGVIGKFPVSFTIPVVTFNAGQYAPGNNWTNPFIAGQFDCVAPQPFTLLDWNSVANQSSIANNLNGFLVISHRVGSKKTRYALCNAVIAGVDYTKFLNYGYASLYAGQVIQPNFTVELWQPFSLPGQISLSQPLTLATSILNQPQRYTPNTTVLPNLTAGAVVENALFNAFPVPIPTAFDPSGPWNDNP